MQQFKAYSPRIMHTCLLASLLYYSCLRWYHPIFPSVYVMLSAVSMFNSLKVQIHLCHHRIFLWLLIHGYTSLWFTLLKIYQLHHADSSLWLKVECTQQTTQLLVVDLIYNIFLEVLNSIQYCNQMTGYTSMSLNS